MIQESLLDQEKEKDEASDNEANAVATNASRLQGKVPSALQPEIKLNTP